MTVSASPTREGSYYANRLRASTVPPDRSKTLAGLVLGLTIIAAFALVDVLGTVFFAITVAYVLYPVREFLVDRGLSHRIASTVVTSTAFVILGLLIAPISWVLYEQRTELFIFFQRIPETVTLQISEFDYVIETAPVLTATQEWIQQLAIDIAQATPVLGLKVVVFTLLVYGLLYRPRAARAAVLRIIPADQHDIVHRLHERTKATLNAIYILQGATAVGTAAIALLVFWALGYRNPVPLAIVAGLLQFIPVVGPSVVVIGLAIGDVMNGAIDRAILVSILGLVLVGFMPDAVIRTQLVSWAADLPVSLYFVGFVGGILSLGVIGFVAGPLIIALLVEMIALLSYGGSVQQSQL